MSVALARPDAALADIDRARVGGPDAALRDRDGRGLDALRATLRDLDAVGPDRAVISTRSARTGSGHPAPWGRHGFERGAGPGGLRARLGRRVGLGAAFPRPPRAAPGRLRAGAGDLGRRGIGRLGHRRVGSSVDPLSALVGGSVVGSIVIRGSSSAFRRVAGGEPPAYRHIARHARVRYPARRVVNASRGP